MRSCVALVNPLASISLLWHRDKMTKSHNKSREDRLAEALRANLRRRKRSDVDTKPALVATEPSSEVSPE
jgi:hypothetical protein